MSDRSGARRNSAAMFLTRAADTATTVVPTIFVWLSIRSRWPQVVGVPVDLVFALAATAAAVGLGVGWWTTRFAFDGSWIELSSGLLVRRSTSLSWSEVASVQVSRSPAARVLGCARVTIGIGSGSQSDLVLETVPQRTADAVQACFERGRGTRAPEPPATPTRSTQHSGRLRPVYRIRPRDYVVLSVTYGQFVLLVPFLLSLVENLSDLSRLTAVSVPFEQSAPSWRLALLVLLLGLPVAVIFGTCVAWLRYRGFEVHESDDLVVTTGGLISAESRRVSGSDVLGIKVQQNPLMRATGVARVAVVSRQSGRRVGANVVFPAVRVSSLRERLRESFGAYAVLVDAPGQARSKVGWPLVAGCGLVLAAGLWALRDASPWAVVTSGLTAVVAVVLANYVWVAAEVHVEDRVLVVRRGFAWVTRYVVSLDAIYFAQAFHARVRRQRMGLLCFGLWDSRAIRLWVPTRHPVLLDEFVHAVAGEAHQ